MLESEIRPEDLFAKYLQLAQKDAELLAKTGEMELVHCPACDSESSDLEFSKQDFCYHRCKSCRTLYLNPRPTILTYESFYKNSESTKFWSQEFFPAVMDKRRELMFAPRAKSIAPLAVSSDSEFTVLEVGAGYGLFLIELRKLLEHCRYIAIEPEPSMAQACRDAGLEVIEDIAENVDETTVQADLIVCFEVFEHVHSPRKFLETLCGLLKPGGTLLFTTLGADGFDLSVLNEKSSSVSPPHHINFFSRAAFEYLCRQVGLVGYQLTTPGKLDVELVRKAMTKDKSVLSDSPFLRAIISDHAVGASFQSFLAENRLSSHSWIQARKPRI